MGLVNLTPITVGLECQAKPFIADITPITTGGAHLVVDEENIPPLFEGRV